MPVTMEKFVQHVRQSATATAHKLRTQWVDHCCDVINTYRDDIERWMPQDNEVSELIIVFYEI